MLRTAQVNISPDVEDRAWGTAGAIQLEKVFPPG